MSCRFYTHCSHSFPRWIIHVYIYYIILCMMRIISSFIHLFLSIVCLSLIGILRVNHGRFYRHFIQLHGGIRKTATQHEQPHGYQDQAIDGGIPKGNLTKQFKAVQSQDFRNKIQKTQESNEETETVPTRAKGNGVVRTPPSNANVDKDEDDAQADPFEGVNEDDETLRHDV
mmetsp:Transcript_62226/g.93972  ORF Transcript_62226/g.93972 Transcript_62226/m.93972 type:complete len:172 (-) Transcript_62226:703-1218(-)